MTVLPTALTSRSPAIAAPATATPAVTLAATGPTAQDNGGFAGMLAAKQDAAAPIPAISQALPTPAIALPIAAQPTNDTGNILPATAPALPVGAAHPRIVAAKSDDASADEAPSAAATNQPDPTPVATPQVPAPATAALVSAMAANTLQTGTAPATGDATDALKPTSMRPAGKPSAAIAARAINVASDATSAAGRTAALPEASEAATARLRHGATPVAPRPTTSDTASDSTGSEAKVTPQPAATTPVAPTPAATHVATAHSATLTTAPAIATATAATAERPTDFATLVDSIARARSDNAAQGSSAPVGVTLQHGDFGRVSLSFSARDDGLSVTMASSDPGFAPAVAAAANSSGAAHAGGNPQQDQPPSGNPSQSFAPQGQPSLSGNQADTGSSASQSDSGQQSFARTAASRPALNLSASAGEPADDAGIFA